MHSGREVSAFASVTPRVPTAPGGMPVLQQLLTRQEQSLNVAESIVDQLMQKLDVMGAPEVPVNTGINAPSPSCYVGAMQSVEILADRLERLSHRLDYALSRLAAAV